MLLLVLINIDKLERNTLMTISIELRDLIKKILKLPENDKEFNKLVDKICKLIEVENSDILDNEILISIIKKCKGKHGTSNEAVLTCIINQINKYILETKKLNEKLAEDVKKKFSFRELIKNLFRRRLR